MVTGGLFIGVITTVSETRREIGGDRGPAGFRPGVLVVSRDFDASTGIADDKNCQKESVHIDRILIWGTPDFKCVIPTTS
jgi:hypothetical protein